MKKSLICKVCAVFLALMLICSPLSVFASDFETELPLISCPDCGEEWSPEATFAELERCPYCMEHACGEGHCVECGSCYSVTNYACADVFEVSCGSLCGACCERISAQAREYYGCTSELCKVCAYTDEYSEHICTEHNRCKYICVAESKYNCDIDSVICEYCGKCLASHTDEDFCEYCSRCIAVHTGPCEMNPAYCKVCGSVHTAAELCELCGKCPQAHATHIGAACDYHDKACQCFFCPVHGSCLLSAEHSDEYSCKAVVLAAGGTVYCDSFCAVNDGCEYCDKCHACLNESHSCEICGAPCDCECDHIGGVVVTAPEYNAESCLTLNVRVSYAPAIPEEAPELIVNAPVYLIDPQTNERIIYGYTDSEARLTVVIDTADVPAEGWIIGAGTAVKGEKFSAGIFRYDEKSVELDTLTPDAVNGARNIELVISTREMLGSIVTVTVKDALGEPLSNAPVYVYTPCNNKWNYAGRTAISGTPEQRTLTVNFSFEQLLDEIGVLATNDVKIRAGAADTGKEFLINGELYTSGEYSVYGLRPYSILGCEVSVTPAIATCGMHIGLSEYIAPNGNRVIPDTVINYASGSGTAVAARQISLVPGWTNPVSEAVTALDYAVIPYASGAAMPTIDELEAIEADSWKQASRYGKTVISANNMYAVICFRLSFGDKYVYELSEPVSFYRAPCVASHGILPYNASGKIGSDGDELTVCLEYNELPLRNITVNGQILEDTEFTVETLPALSKGHSDKAEQIYKIDADVVRTLCFGNAEYEALGANEAYPLEIGFEFFSEDISPESIMYSVPVSVYGDIFDELSVLDSIEPLADVSSVANGVPKTVEGLCLPRTVILNTSGGVCAAEVKWDVSSCDYDVYLKTEQYFTVTGEAVLPADVENTISIPLEVVVNVTVNKSYTRNIEVIGIASEFSAKIVKLGAVIQLLAAAYPSDANGTELTWSSDAPEVVSVTDAGEITALALGTAIITARAGNGMSAAYSITVTENECSHSPISATCTEPCVCKICNEQLTEALGHTPAAPATCTNDSLCVRCSTIIEEKLGHQYSDEWTVDIPATLTSEGSKSHHCVRCDSVKDVTVIPVLVYVTGMTLDKAAVEIKMNGSVSIIPTITPENASDKSISWRSSNTAIATVSNQGVVTGVSEGRATIIASTVDGGYTATCVVMVGPADPLYKSGDVDGNGNITTDDARMALRYTVGLETLSDEQFRAADVDGNGQITTDDARIILRVTVGLDTLN